MREWAVAGLDFWTRIQHRDGSFDEYYPNEHGYIPTSFSLYAAVETCRVLELSNDTVLAACLRAAGCLSRRVEVRALNQEAAAIPGLYGTYLLSGEEWVADRTEAKLQCLLAKQRAEGWFEEYGGADLGYLSTTLDFLLEYYGMSGDERAWESAERIVEFAQYFVHQDGTVGGQYGSRNTEYFLLSGLSAMAAKSSIAAAMLLKLRDHMSDSGWIYRSFDDRYLCHNMLHSLLRAVGCAAVAGTSAVALPCDRRHERHFPDAGLLSLNDGRCHLLCATKKGGSLRLFAAGRELFQDCGFRLRSGSGAIAANNWLNHDTEIVAEDGGYRVRGNFTVVGPQRVTPWRHLLLRLAALVFGRRLIPFLKRRLIFIDRRSAVRFERAIQMSSELLQLNDVITADHPISGLRLADKYSLRHVASSKYFQMDELSAGRPQEWEGIRQLQLWRKIGLVDGHTDTTSEVN